MTLRHWMVVAAASALGATLWLLHGTVPGPGFTSDEGAHLVLARALADGAGYPADAFRAHADGAPTPPLVPLLLALVWRLGGDFPANLPALRLVSGLAALGIVWLLPLYLVRVGVPARAAVAAAALTAVSPLVLRQATSVVSALPLGFFMLAALLAAERAADPGQRFGAGVLAGACAGLTCLIRWSGVPFALVLGLQLARRAGDDRSAGYCYGLVLTVLPWIAWLVAYGRITAPADLTTMASATVGRLAELPAMTTLAALPGFADLTKHGATTAQLVLTYGVGLATLAATYPLRFGPPVVAVLASSVLAPIATFPMALTPLLLAALLATVFPTTGSPPGRLLPAAVVVSLLATASLGQYHYWLGHGQALDPATPLSVASVPGPP